MRNHYSIIRMAEVKRPTIPSVIEEVDGAAGMLVYCSWKCKIAYPFWEIVWKYLKKLNIYLSYDPAVLLLGMAPKE